MPASSQVLDGVFNSASQLGVIGAYTILMVAAGYVATKWMIIPISNSIIEITKNIHGIVLATKETADSIQEAVQDLKDEHTRAKQHADQLGKIVGMEEEASRAAGR